MSDLDELIEKNKSRQVENPVFLTGYADGSYSNQGQHQGGAWGIWVRDHQTRILRAGPCPTYVHSSNDAEICAVWAAIYTAVTLLRRDQANIIVVKTDSQTACAAFGYGESGRPRMDSRIWDLVRKSLELADRHDLKVVVSWVKGHQKADNVKAYLNGRVDKMARRARETSKTEIHTMKVRHGVAPEAVL